MRANKYPSQKELLSRFDYGFKTGCLYFSNRVKSCKRKGNKVGRVKMSGDKRYIQTKVCGQACYVHRLIWIMFKGQIKDLDMQVDHINGDSTDNRIENLRLVTRCENNRNKRRSAKGSVSGITGVTFDKSAGKWKAHIQIGRSHINLGLFNKKEEARKARKLADVKYGFHSNHGKDSCL